jgi:hypothetical protein
LSDVITNEIVKSADAKTAAYELLKVTEPIAYLTSYPLGGPIIPWRAYRPISVVETHIVPLVYIANT